MVGGRVHHHVDDALDVSVDGRQARDVHAEAPRYGGSNLFSFELFPFNLARLDDVFGEGAKVGLRTQVEADAFHLAEQSALFT
jgi:hypothetical protein